MDNTKEVNQLRSALKLLKEDDLLPALFLMELDIEFNTFEDFQNYLDKNVLHNFINRLNMIKELSEIRQLILNYYSEQNIFIINNYIDEINHLTNNLKNRGKDLSKYSSNPRLLAFALNYYASDYRHWNRRINNISNKFFRLLFILYCHPYYSQCYRDLENIEETYSRIINKHPVHFLKSDTSDFYHWAKNYMDDHDDKYNSKIYTPINDQEYKTAVNIILDKLFDDNEDIYSALKEKLSNAWYQKNYRQKNKGKKAHHYVLQKNTLIALESLASKCKLTHEKIIENLINEYYVKECADPNSGDSLY